MKRLLLAVLLALFGVGAGLFYLWKQATQLPSWYTEEDTTETANSATPDSAATSANQSKSKSPTQTSHHNRQVEKSIEKKIAEEVQQAPNRDRVNVQLDQTEVRHLFTSEMARKAESSKLGRAVKGVNTTVQDGKVESGAVVNLADVPMQQLPSHEQSVLAKMRAAFPEMTDRNLYIGIEGKPSVKNGQVKLDDDMRVRIGNLSFTPAELSQRLGIPEDQIRKQIGLQLQLGNLKVDNFELLGDRAVIRGAAN